jgi:hypothetical protein
MSNSKIALCLAAGLLVAEGALAVMPAPRCDAPVDVCATTATRTVAYPEWALVTYPEASHIVYPEGVLVFGGR